MAHKHYNAGFESQKDTHTKHLESCYYKTRCTTDNGTPFWQQCPSERVYGSIYCDEHRETTRDGLRNT